MDRQNDPWADHTASWPQEQATEVFDEPPAPVRSVRVTTARLVTVCVLALLLLTVAVGSSILAFVNNDRATSWRDRSDSLQALVADRTKSLNDQTKRLNTAADSLKKSQTALTRSEKDVIGLQRRQTELANEKAQLADERAFLKRATTLLRTCNEGLTQVLSEATAGRDPSMTLNIEQISRTCQSAGEAIPSSVE